jgi:prepilin-type N-terminal cleavage/methylation domain-containing protein
MKTLHRSRKGGFTLIELLVVIAIIAILTGIIITNLVASKAKSRDAKRASDLSQIALALEQYFDRCDEYPPNPLSLSADGPSPGLVDCPKNNGTQITLGSFISVIPTDPSSGNAYGYFPNPNIQPPSDYVLYTTFEASNPTWALPSDFNCQSGLNYCVRPN